MKWENKGHEFDTLGELYKNVNKIYLYGASDNAKEFLECLNNALDRFDGGCRDLDIYFVDRDENKQRDLFLGTVVLSPDEFVRGFNVTNSIVINCVTEVRQDEVWKILEEIVTGRKIDAYNMYEFYRYLSLFIYYRYNKFYLHLVDFYLHTYCNLNCEGCFVQTYRGVRIRISESDIKRNLDLLFEKADYIDTITFGISEGFLGGNGLIEALNYLNVNYPDRYQKVDIVTNGTLIPDEELLQELRAMKVRVIVDDYRENVELANEKYPIVIKKLKENNVRFIELKRDHWDESAFGEKKIDENHQKLSDKINRCVNHAKGFPYIGYGNGECRIYSCVFQAINAYLHLVDEQESDFLILRDSSPIEILEFILGYSQKGYLSACESCKGIFDGVRVNYIPVARQPKEENE